MLLTRKHEPAEPLLRQSSAPPWVNNATEYSGYAAWEISPDDEDNLIDTARAGR